MYKVLGADQKEYGPVTADQIRQWISERRLNGLSMILAEGGTEWKPLSQFSEFAEALATSPQAPGAAVPGATLPTTIPGTLYSTMPATAIPHTNTMALTGFIMGLVSCVCCCSCLPISVLGVVFSAIGLSQINKNPEVEQGRGLAIAGLVLSIISVLLGIAGMIFNFMNPAFLEEIQRELKAR